MKRITRAEFLALIEKAERDGTGIPAHTEANRYVPAPPKIQQAVRAASKTAPNPAALQVANRFLSILSEQNGWSMVRALRFAQRHAAYALAGSTHSQARTHKAQPRPRERRRSHPGRRQGSRRVTQSRGDPDPPGDDEPSGGRHHDHLLEDDHLLAGGRR